MKKTFKTVMAALLVFALLLVPNSQSFAAGVTINLTNAPSNITQGHSFDLRGTVSSNVNITSFKGVVYNSAGKSVASQSESPNKKTVDIHSSKVNNIKFGSLGVGSYTLKLTATDANSNTLTKSYSFKVTNSSSTLKINMTSYPSGTLTKGKSFNLAGTVSSNYNIKKIKAKVIYTQTGSLALGEVEYNPSNTKSVQIKDTVINKNLKFGSLPAGEFTLIIYAWDTSGEPFIDKRYHFYVK